MALPGLKCCTRPMPHSHTLDKPRLTPSLRPYPESETNYPQSGSTNSLVTDAKSSRSKQGKPSSPSTAQSVKSSSSRSHRQHQGGPSPMRPSSTPAMSFRWHLCSPSESGGVASAASCDPGETLTVSPAILRASRDCSPHCCLETMWQQQLKNLEPCYSRVSFLITPVV